MHISILFCDEAVERLNLFHGDKIKENDYEKISRWSSGQMLDMKEVIHLPLPKIISQLHPLDTDSRLLPSV